MSGPRVCENSYSDPCPNNVYRFVVLSVEGFVLMRVYLCRRHYRRLMALSLTKTTGPYP